MVDFPWNWPNFCKVSTISQVPFHGLLNDLKVALEKSNEEMYPLEEKIKRIQIHSCLSHVPKLRFPNSILYLSHPFPKWLQRPNNHTLLTPDTPKALPCSGSLFSIEFHIIVVPRLLSICLIYSARDLLHSSEIIHTYNPISNAQIEIIKRQWRKSLNRTFSKRNHNHLSESLYQPP